MPLPWYFSSPSAHAAQNSAASPFVQYDGAFSPRTASAVIRTWRISFQRGKHACTYGGNARRYSQILCDRVTVSSDSAQRGERANLRYFIHRLEQQVLLHACARMGQQPVRGLKNGQRTIIPLNPRAPPPLSTAFWQISSSAALANLISTPEYPKRAVYCEMSDPRTSVRTRLRSAAESGASVVIEGRRPMNSGMKLWESRARRGEVNSEWKRPEIGANECIPVLHEIWWACFSRCDEIEGNPGMLTSCLDQIEWVRRRLVRREEWEKAASAVLGSLFCGSRGQGRGKANRLQRRRKPSGRRVNQKTKTTITGNSMRNVVGKSRKWTRRLSSDMLSYIRFSLHLTSGVSDVFTRAPHSRTSRIFIVF